jgi:hypothetical protein
MSVRLSACISAAQSGQVFVKFGIADLIKISREHPDLFKVDQKKSVTLREDVSTCYYCRRYQIVIKAFLTVICNTAMQKEGIVAFSRQPLLIERATV